jgi:hypothetical protein
MQLTVGRIVHYYDDRGAGPIAALVVAVDTASAQLELHPWSTYARPDRYVDVPREAGASGNGASWRWPPRE